MQLVAVFLPYAASAWLAYHNKSCLAKKKKEREEAHTKNCPSPSRSPSQNEIICQSILHWFGATRFCTSKYFKSIFFTYFHKPPAGSPLPRLPVPPSFIPLTPHSSIQLVVRRCPSRTACGGKKFARKVQFLKNICKFHSLRSSIQISCIYVVVLKGRGQKKKQRQKKGETPKEINGNKGQNSAAELAFRPANHRVQQLSFASLSLSLPLPLPLWHPLFIFGTFARAQGPFVILRRQQEIALRCLSFFFFALS